MVFETATNKKSGFAGQERKKEGTRYFDDTNIICMCCSLDQTRASLVDAPHLAQRQSTAASSVPALLPACLHFLRIPDYREAVLWADW